MREKSIRDCESSLKDKESSIWVREQSYKDRVLQLKEAEKNLFMERRKNSEFKEQYEREYAENVHYKSSLEKLKRKAMYEAREQYDELYCVYRMLFIFCVITTLFSGIFNGSIGNDIMNLWLYIMGHITHVYHDAGIINVFICLFIFGIFIGISLCLIKTYRDKYMDHLSICVNLFLLFLCFIAGGYVRSKWRINCVAVYMAAQIVYLTVRIIIDKIVPDNILGEYF